MPLSHNAARQVLLQFDDNPEILQGMQAVGWALSAYGARPNDSDDNNWFAVGVPANPDGTCPTVGGLSSRPYPLVMGGAVCSFSYMTPQQGIQHALSLWFPPRPDGSPDPDLNAFAQALLAGDSSRIAQMVMQRAWGIPRRGITTQQYGVTAAPVFAIDLFSAAQEIAQFFGEPLVMKAPGAQVSTLPALPLPINVTPVPLPNGNEPPVVIATDCPAGQVKNAQGQCINTTTAPPPPASKKDDGFPYGKVALAAVALAALVKGVQSLSKK